MASGVASGRRVHLGTFKVAHEAALAYARFEAAMESESELVDDASEFAVGDRVRVLFIKPPRFYPGKVAAVESKFVYRIHFDDGDVVNVDCRELVIKDGAEDMAEDGEEGGGEEGVEVESQRQRQRRERIERRTAAQQATEQMGARP